MHAIYLLPFYLKWHYSEAFSDLFQNWKSFLIFVSHLFSIKLLLKTWLSPFSRLDERYSKTFSLEAFLETFVVNTMMRLVGFVMRAFVIITGLIALALVFIAGLVAFAFWALAPLVVISLFIQGLSLLFDL